MRTVGGLTAGHRTAAWVLRGTALGQRRGPPPVPTPGSAPASAACAAAWAGPAAPSLPQPSHAILTIVWHLLTHGGTYQDLGSDYYDANRDDPDTLATRLKHKIETLGYSVTLSPAG